jgi:hypothetical protein
MEDYLRIALSAIAIVLAIVIPLVAYLNNVATKARNEISEHKTHVAENYATKDDVKDLGDRMERQMKSGFENLKLFLTNRRTD